MSVTESENLILQSVTNSPILSEYSYRKAWYINKKHYQYA